MGLPPFGNDPITTARTHPQDERQASRAPELKRASPPSPPGGVLDAPRAAIQPHSDQNRTAEQTAPTKRAATATEPHPRIRCAFERPSLQHKATTPAQSDAIRMPSDDAL